MSYIHTYSADTVIHKNLDNRMYCIHKFYAWLDVNDDTPVEIKLLILEQCMFSSLLYGIETWGDTEFFGIRILKIELDALKRILKVKSGTSNDLIYFELERPDIVSRVKRQAISFL